VPGFASVCGRLLEHHRISPKTWERLARGTQGVALTSGEAFRLPDRLDLVQFVGFGNRWKAHDLPRLLAEHMADQIVFVQALHSEGRLRRAACRFPAVEDGRTSHWRPAAGWRTAPPRATDHRSGSSRRGARSASRHSRRVSRSSAWVNACGVTYLGWASLVAAALEVATQALR
jgi:hypothetical protein